MHVDLPPPRVRAVNVGGQLLVVASSFGLAAGRHPVVAEVGTASIEVGASVFPEARGGVPGLLVVSLKDTDVRAADVGAVRLGGGNGAADAAATIELTVDGVGELLREGLSGAPAPVREEALAFLLVALVDGRPTLRPEVGLALATARSVLRERWPARVIDRDSPPTAAIDVFVRVDHHAYYFRGWLGYEIDDLVSLRLVSPEGQRVAVPPTAFRYPRPDVTDLYGLGTDQFTDLGIAALCVLDLPNVLVTGWVLEVETTAGFRFEVPCPPAASDAVDARDKLVADLALERPPGSALRAHHIAPAIVRVQERMAAKVRITRTEQFGTGPVDPDVSIIVPLYKRIDLVEHQLAQFVHDPEITAADLIYVLDSPEQERQLLAECDRLAPLYRVPFRVVVLSANGGFSTANNLGVSVAAGRLLLLMNSDVLPAAPGWLGRLVRFHDSRAELGIVGPKLLYEDDSLQHAGLYWARGADGRTWFNEHFYPGLHRSLPAACVSRRVPAVSAACMMVSAALYRELGGLRGMFVQGDYEDSDLCLRLHDAGYEIWYDAEVELYHLEGQSYPSAQRAGNADFNRWLHTHLWDRRIEAIMADHDLGRHELPARS